ncbi:LOW QUALITY PROTEIN: toll-like receptor 7 [Leguminivora glycinivorella]|uniref:LOW QUALITY PROTEIN: toll-like receptor 7 n=1 Tax=Leguminivora glycinivorella TaxID=1035111 RepID=UPI00200BF738|nr:LOW QUALITY PROTEIN: toll-like receptor 7 [Leguminivora glycinivorella]
MYAVVVICALLRFGRAALPYGSDKCIKVSGAADNSILCRIRTLDSDGAGIATVSSDTRHLSIECNHLLLFESSLRGHYFSSVPDLTELSINNCKLLQVPDGTFQDLRKLKRLKLRSKNFEWSPTKNLELSLNTFNGLSELHSLDLAQNNIKFVPSGVFCSLENLNTLNLTHNRIKTIGQLGLGQGCGSNLHYLDLSHNEIKSLPEESELLKLRSLQSLYLQHNNITDISSEAFNGLVSMRVLNISHNHLHTLPEGLFANARELREVYLNDNSLFELARGIFHRLEQLIVLDLSSNQLTSNHIDDGTFLGLIRLIVLNLSNNALTRIDGKTFKDLFFLQILNLKNNSIGYVEDNAFLPLYNLHTLNLAENRLHTIDENLFNGLFVLSKLTLNNNLLVNIDRKAFKNCSDLKELDLSSNQLLDVPEALWELSFLKTLDLGENQITDFRNGSFKNLNQLTGLRLIDNQIGNLSVGMFWDLPSLQVLNIAKNKIQSIERGTFSRNTQLEAIRLDGNFLSDINGVFSTLASLLWLNLSENHLVWFDYAFVPSNLKWLDIHGNYIEHLGNYYKLQDEIRIKTLDASHNRISEISPMAIPNSVELLFINNNYLNNIHVNTFYEKKNLTRVDMYANEIVHLDQNSLRLAPVPTNKTLPEFYIGGNPIKCDCTMEWLQIVNYTTATRQYPRLMDLENVLCKMTNTRSGTHVPLTNLKSSDFLCAYETHCFAICHCCDYDACDCEMTCPQNCTCYHDPLWNTNVVDCSGQSSIEVPHKIPMDATEVFLDGNNIKELQNHVFIGRQKMRSLYVNNSNVDNIQNRTFAGLNALQILHLGNNKLKELKGYEFHQLSNLKELFLQNNLISHIVNVTFLTLKSLETLRLDGNRLVDFSVWTFNNNPNLKALSLGNNLWSCKCRYLQELTAYLAENAQKIIDITDVWCWNGDAKPPQKKELNLNGTACSDYYADNSVIGNMLVSNYVPMMVSTLTGFMLILLALVILFLFRDSLRVWLYTNCGIRVFSFAGAFEESEKLYDAYVCYSPKDEEFVVQSLAAELENGNPSYHLCLHYRDIPHHGAQYMQCAPPVVEAAEASKRIIIVLTRNFMQTEWSRYEFRQGLHDALKGCIYKLVLIEECTVVADAICDPDLRPYLKTGSRLRWGQKRFWERLRYMMPDSSQPNHKRRSHNYRKNINTYTLDSSVPNGGNRTMPYPDKSPVIGGGQGASAPPEYSSEVRQSPSVVRQTQGVVYGPDGRPISDHIYSSIDSDYSSLEHGMAPGRRRDIRQWPPPPPLVDTGNTVQAYLV